MNLCTGSCLCAYVILAKKYTVCYDSEKISNAERSRKMKKKSMAMLLVLALIVTMIPAGAFAAVEEVAEPIEVTELIS